MSTFPPLLRDALVTVTAAAALVVGTLALPAPPDSAGDGAETGKVAAVKGG